MTTEVKTTVQNTAAKVTTAVKTVVEKASNNAEKSASTVSGKRDSTPSVVTKVTSTSQTKTTGNPRKQVTPEIRKAADEALKWATEPIGSLVEKGKKVWSEHKEIIHTGLDMVGCIPVVGEPADLFNGLIYAAEKDYINTGISIAAVIPVAGDLGKAGKYGVKALKALDNGGDIAKLLREAIKKGPKLSKKNYKAKRIIVDSFEKYVKENADEAVEAVGKGGKAVGKSGKTTVDDLLKGLDETTNGKGVARNFESTGGYDQTLKDFDALNPSNVKDIQTKYGPGKVGTLSDGTKVVARQGSTTGGPTLEIKVSNSKVYKIRY